MSSSAAVTLPLPLSTAAWELLESMTIDPPPVTRTFAPLARFKAPLLDGSSRRIAGGLELDKSVRSSRRSERSLRVWDARRGVRRLFVVFMVSSPKEQERVPIQVSGAST